jgi:RNA polymerase sigma factor (sigma-70 family)
MFSTWPQSLSTPSTSWEMLDLATRKQHEAWTSITKIYAPLVYGWARRSGLHDSDASDATQDVFLKVYLNLAKCDQARGKFRAWLWTITRHTVVEHFRDQKVRPILVQDAFLDNRQQHDKGETDEIESDRIPNPVLLRALEVIRPKFKERTYQAAWQVIALGRRPDDVARDLEMTTGAVYIAKSRLLKELRSTLEGYEF